MAELTPALVSEVIEACQAGADEAAEAFSRALDTTLTVEIGEPGTIGSSAIPDELSGAGLAVVLTVGDKAALVVLPEKTGLLPSWCAAPDPTGESKLTTLAQELGMILLPEAFMPDDFKAAWITDIAESLSRGGLTDEAALVPLQMSVEEQPHTIYLLWPLEKPSELFGATAEEPAPPAAAPPKPAAASAPAAPSAASLAAQKLPPPEEVVPPSIDQLPNYTQSLLRIQIPVVVTLARKRQSLDEIVDLGPGAIIQFDKSCEEMLDLYVGNQEVAKGEAIKVGDKFGLRITSMTLPEERFQTVGPSGDPLPFSFRKKVAY